jgi:MarR family transcriptional regulator, transcriptional regulator for hemolysin
MSHHQPERPEQNLGWLLATVSHAFTTELTAALEAASVTPRAHCVLTTALRGEYSQTALAHAIGLDKTTMVVTIDALERAGLVERRMSSHDRRARVITVTGAGRAKVAEGERIVARIQSDVLASLPGDQREAFMGALQHLLANRLCTTAECTQPLRRRAPRGATMAAV